ncbi:MAG: VOC family protein [Candidatus Hermodarchaeota archaeon]
MTTLLCLKKIDCVMFYVEDLVKSTKFYEEVLGLKIGWKDKEEEMVGFLLPENDSELVLHRDSNLPNPTISFQVENVEEFCTYYKEAGYKVVLEPIVVRCGKYAELQDPDGNRIPIIDLTKFGGKPRYEK